MENIDAVVYCCAKLLVDDLGKGCQAANENVGQILSKVKNIGCWLGSKNWITTIFVQNCTYVGNTK